MTRPTKCFSNKIENQAHTVAIHFVHHNFSRIHQTLRRRSASRLPGELELPIMSEALEEMADVIDSI